MAETIKENIMNKENNIEKMADAQHKIWAHWMDYMFSTGKYNENGDWVMPKEKVDRWKKQAATDYNDLTEKEKESDRDIVRKFINNQ